MKTFFQIQQERLSKKSRVIVGSDGSAAPCDNCPITFTDTLGLLGLLGTGIFVGVHLGKAQK